MRPETTRGHSMARLVFLVTGVVVALVLLDGMGDALPRLPSWHEAARVLASADPIMMGFGVLRVVAIGLCWYVLATTALGLLARMTRIPALIRATDLIMLPSIRRLLRGVAGVSLATSLGASTIGTVAIVAVTRPSVASAAPVIATQSSDTAPTMRVLDGPPASSTSTTSPASGPTATMHVIEDPGPATAEGRPSATMRVEPSEPNPPLTPPPPTTTATTSPSVTPTPTPTSPTSQPANGTADANAPEPDLPEAPTLPATSTAPGSPEPSFRTTPETWTIAPGDHLWRVSQVTLRVALGRDATDGETASYLEKVIASNGAVFAVPGQPDLVFPGQVFVLPTP